MPASGALARQAEPDFAPRPVARNGWPEPTSTPFITSFSTLMLVLKRDGRRESVKFDKVTARIEKLCYGLNMNFVAPIEVAKKVIDGIYDGVTTVELDNLAAETAASLTTKHPDYAILAARIAVSNLHKVTSKSFSSTMKRLHTYEDPKTGENASLVAQDVWEIVHANAATLDSAIIYDRDYNYDYFGFKTLERSYLLRLDGKVVERPQHMLMRVAVGIHKQDIAAAIETYELMSERWFTHATPTLFNAGTPKPQLSSCFVAGTKVFTLDGVKNIEDVTIGDLVVTHQGNVKPVEQLHCNPLNGRQLYRLRAFGSPALSVTGNHRFWSITKEQLGWGEQPQWNSTEALREGDYVAIPNKTEVYTPETVDLADHLPAGYGNIELDVEQQPEWLYPTSTWERQHQLNVTDTAVRVSRAHNPVKRHLVLNQDFAFLLGLWLGDGHVMLGRNAQKTHQFVRGIGFTMHHEAYELIGRVTALCQELFGVPASVSAPNSTNTVSITVSSHLIGHWFNEQFGKRFDGKKLPAFLYRWDAPMVQAFMEGLTTSDGCVTQCGDVRIAMSNVSLVKEIFALCRNVGMDVSYSEAQAIKQGATARTARISLPKQSVLLTNVYKQYTDDRLERMRDKQAHSSHVKEINGQKFLRISEKVKLADQPEFVYTLGVADDHSYCVEGVMVENCFLLTMKDDSIDGIYDTLKNCALISQSAGGIGLAVHNVRATGTYIKGTNGTSNGLVPMLKVFNDTARYVDQGGGKRKGAFAIYLEPWHADIFDFLDLKKNHGKEEMRARDLFYALWTPDLFMKRVEANGDWTLMCPHECPGLDTSHGAEFEKLYQKYEREGKGRKTIKAQELWFAILESQTETGTPYMLFKDAANGKSNQQNLGTIKSSNLCTEIMEYTDENEVAVCNLASLALPRYVRPDEAGNLFFDHQKLYEVTYHATLNLNKVIDINYYPVPEAERSNRRHRPIGLGVQGLADTFIALRMPFESDEATGLNKDIFETLYFAAMTASKDLAKRDGHYETFPGSPLSQGKFQFDLWGVTPDSGRWDWDTLRAQVMEHGARNSLLVAPMPTASTAQILGNNESFEPYTSNIYVRRVLSGEFMVVNKHLLKDLIKLGLWNEQMKTAIIAANGSVQDIPSIPQHIKDLYKTVWEISQRRIIDMSADRGAYICQSQSLNLHVLNVNFGKLTSMHFHSWKKGLKTGMYYLRTKAAADAIKFTVQKQAAETLEPLNAMAQNQSDMSCSLDDPDGCEACGS